MCGIKPELSICISSYNNREWIYELVTNILNCSDNRFNVVVSDNCSTDGTIEKLKTVEDNRLKLYQNEVNLGPTLNYMKALWYGDGKIILFMIDKDQIIADNIPCFIDLLLNQQFTVGYCKYNYQGNTNINVLPKGKKALSGLSYLMAHPTGYLYNREYMTRVRNMEWYGNVENVGVFPFEFLNADLACLGDAVQVQLPLLYPRKVTEYGKIPKSLTYLKEKNNLFFEPDKRLEMMGKCLVHILELSAEKSVKNSISEKVLYTLCLNATYGYREILKDPIRCKHYGLDTRNVRFGETLVITRKFAESYNEIVGGSVWRKKKATICIYLYIIFKEVKAIVKKLIWR